MEHSTRRIIATVLVVTAVLVAVFAGGGQVGMCLGPLGVTAVQCAQATGVFPDIGSGLPILLIAGSLALVLVAPPRRSRWVRSVFATVIGAAVGAGAYLALAPRTMDGMTSNGTLISIARPIDANALVSMATLAAVAGYVLAAHVGRPQRGLGRGTSPSSGPAGR